MTTPYIDPKNIFASNAPTQDKPPRFDNYDKGMDETRKNNGRPTIKQLNYLHQQTDLKILYIHENGAGLPYVAGIDYQEGALILKDGELVQKSGNDWVSIKTKNASELSTANTQTQQEINDSVGAKWYAKEGGYAVNARVMLDNGDIVRNTVANNTNDPNSNMAGWFLIEGNTIAIVESIAELSNLDVYEGKVVYVKSYYKNGDTRGGSFFIYVASSDQTIDDIFVFQGKANGYWFRQYQERINIYQTGIDTSIDCTIKLNTVLEKLKEKSISISKVIEIDGFSTALPVSDMINVDVSHVFVKNLTLHMSETKEFTAPTAILKMNGSVTENVTLPKSSTLFDNLVIKGPAFRTVKPVFGLLMNPEVNLNLPTLDRVRILNCNGGLVLGSNTYISSINNSHIHRNNVAIIDSVSAGFETDTVNAGENISFNHCVISENNTSMIVNDYNGSLCNFKFSNTSFDYNGGGVGVNYKQFILDGGQYDFFGCHFESGNINDGQTDNYFDVGNETKVNLFGGWIMFPNQYNSIPFFFNSRGVDDRSTQAVFNLYNTMIYGPAMEYWANRDLGDFKPNISISDYTTSGRWQKKNTLMLNGDMANKTALIDNWFVEMNQTLYDNGIRQSNKQITTQISVSMSNKGVLIVRPSAAVADATRGGKVYLLVPRPRSRYNPTVKFKIKSDNATNISPIYVTCSPVQWSGFVSDYRIPENMQSPEEIGVSVISSLTTDEVEYSPVSYAAQKDNFLNCNYILLTFNLASNQSVLSFYITDIELSQPN